MRFIGSIFLRNFKILMLIYDIFIFEILLNSAFCIELLSVDSRIGEWNVLSLTRCCIHNSCVIFSRGSELILYLDSPQVSSVLILEITISPCLIRIYSIYIDLVEIILHRLTSVAFYHFFFFFLKYFLVSLRVRKF
jgi:hypothetical protein